ncbi:MAG: hypothetical protein IKD70_09840 [Eggerthellaceae bacterium]|nr:hypothetical protein [Eggerthellaceae bacterium]
MIERIMKALADLRARQTAGEWMPCPRCGRDTLKPALHTNALSRHADGIYICDECGTAEAMLDFMNNPLPTELWAMFRSPQPESDLKALPGTEVWKRIATEHGPILIDLYKRWTREAPGASFTPYRWEAFKRCPGLTEIWDQPFQAKYSVADGELILRLRHTEEGVEIAADLLENAK